MTLLRSCRSSRGAKETAKLGTVAVDAMRDRPFIWSCHADRGPETVVAPEPSKRPSEPATARIARSLNDDRHVSGHAAHYVRRARGFGAHTTMAATRGA